MSTTDDDRRPHSRACGITKHDHGTACHSNCPTCHGRDEVKGDAPDAAGAPVDRLAQFIMEHVPGEPSQSQGAVDTAIRVITELQAELARRLPTPTGTEGVTYLPPVQFVDLGLLQEANRQFFHPRGLALEVQLSVDIFPGGASMPDHFIVGIWDDRADPDGMRFADGVIDPIKAATVAAMVRNDPQEVPQ